MNCSPSFKHNLVLTIKSSIFVVCNKKMTQKWQRIVFNVQRLNSHQKPSTSTYAVLYVRVSHERKLNTPSISYSRKYQMNTVKKYQHWKLWRPMSTKHSRRPMPTTMVTLHGLNIKKLYIINNRTTTSHKLFQILRRQRLRPTRQNAQSIEQCPAIEITNFANNLRLIY